MKKRSPLQKVQPTKLERRFNCFISSEEYDRLVRLCEKKKTTASSFFRSALADACKKEQIL